MPKKECIAMLLAGGQGSRLRVLTKNIAKPAVPFGGQYRIIDFSLSNCVNSGIDVVGVLTQYKPLQLNSHIGIGQSWDLVTCHGGATILPPYVGEKGGQWYKGTAHAVFQNISFIEKYEPQYVLILSGDHIYRMDYSKMLEYHKKNQASITIAVMEVPWEEASRFGIMSINDEQKIVEFEEKPENPNSNLASMGIYIFNWDVLKKRLINDAKDPTSDNDFGKNVIPRMLRENEKMFAYPFTGYWRDVGTVESYWSASMDVLDDETELDLFDPEWMVFSLNKSLPPHYVADSASIQTALVSEGCMVLGNVDRSILFPGVELAEGSKIKNSIIMSDTYIGKNVLIENAIIGENVRIGDGSIIGSGSISVDYSQGNMSLLPRVTVVEDNSNLAANSRIGLLLNMASRKDTVIYKEPISL